MREVAALPLAEDIPIAFNSCRKGPRHIEWRDDKPAELCWIECQVLPPRPCTFNVAGRVAFTVTCKMQTWEQLHSWVQQLVACHWVANPLLESHPDAIKQQFGSADADHSMQASCRP